MTTSKNWTGNSKATFTTLGASSHSEGEREVNDYYATDPNTIDDLLKIVDLPKDMPILEPSCGEGHLSKKFIENGYEVISWDLVDRGFGIPNKNFLKQTTDDVGTRDINIITNPPYKYAQQFVEHSMELINDGCKVVMFLKVLFLESVSRYAMFKKYPPKYVYIYSKRQKCAMNGDFDSYPSSATAYAWFVWEKGFTGEPIIRWIDPEPKENFNLETLF